jgi:uncharacterized protein (TIGR02145 family)
MIIWLAFLFTVITIQAQDYILDFKATGASNEVTTVHVKNLATGDTLSMPGTDLLRLTAISGSGAIPATKCKLSLNPNPTDGITELCVEYFPRGLVTVEISDNEGRWVAGSNGMLTNDRSYFRIAGLGTGLYFIRVTSPEIRITGKALSSGKSSGEVSIMQEFTSRNSFKHDSESENKIWEMIFHDGETLMFTGKNGHFTTIFTDIPAASKTEWIEFTDCTDADSNHYPVVQICNQTWMARNLNVGQLTEVPHDNRIIQKHCYGYRVSNCNVYGGLYDWNGMMNGNNTEGSQGICPAGWHIPSHAEWSILYGCQGGLAIAAANLKEADTIHWKTPNTGALNSTGFSALPGGDYDGNSFHYGMLGYIGFFWTSSQYVYPFAYRISMEYNSTTVYASNFSIHEYLSVRCLKN